MRRRKQSGKEGILLNVFLETESCALVRYLAEEEAEEEAALSIEERCELKDKCKIKEFK